jgi:outer membrane protein OmpA-like peptidoglycan-associated protein
MAEIPVERKEKSSFPWWLIPLLLLLLLVPFLYFCNKSTVGDNTNGNYNNNRTGSVAVSNSSNGSTLKNGNSAFNEEARIREANERARLAMQKVYPNGTPQQVIEALNLSVVNFVKGSSDIPADNKPLLKQAAEMLKKSPADTRVEIDGYTDNDGDDTVNQKLSERRAATVRNELVSFGVPAAMLSMKGYGETNPKSSNDTPEGRFENRRIEYKVATSDTTSEKVVPDSNNAK